MLRLICLIKSKVINIKRKYTSRLDGIGNSVNEFLYPSTPMISVNSLPFLRFQFPTTKDKTVKLGFIWAFINNDHSRKIMKPFVLTELEIVLKSENQEVRIIFANKHFYGEVYSRVSFFLSFFFRKDISS